METLTKTILDVLNAHDIRPLEDDIELQLPSIGELEEGETVYTTSIAEVFPNRKKIEDRPWPDLEDQRLREWWQELERIIEKSRESIPLGRGETTGAYEQPEPHCAWYCPIHFFGHSWGIYIRESCILSRALDIATAVDWGSVRAPMWEIPKQILRSAFYVFFLHEQFHHKVESLGLRLLVATATDHYRPYKKNVYRPSFLTSACLEESLANAESYRRLGEDRYKERIDPAIRSGLRNYLKLSFPLQPPGYAEGVRYLTKNYRDGLNLLQSQILDGALSPTTPPGHWAVAPDMIGALSPVTDEIYMVLPHGVRPILPVTSIDPGWTASSRDIEGALTKHHGYRAVPGGKGSHVKLAKQGAPTIILPGNRHVLSPGVVKQILDAIGGYPISRLPDLLGGRLA